MSIDDDPATPRDAARDGRKPLVKTITIAASPEHIFPFFTDPEKMLQWIGTEVELEPRPGGTFRVVPNRVDVIRGKYLEIVPPTRVVFTWGFEGSGQALPAGGSVVEITLRAVDGGTEVQLVHRGLPDGMIDAHRHGWEHYLARVETAAEGRDPGADPLATPDVRHGRSIDHGVSGA